MPVCMYICIIIIISSSSIIIIIISIIRIIISSIISIIISSSIIIIIIIISSVCIYIYIYVRKECQLMYVSKCVRQMYLYCQTSVHTSRSFSGGLITVECSPKFVYPSPLSQKIKANKKPSICHRPHQPNQPSLRLCARLNSSCHPKCARL